MIVQVIGVPGCETVMVWFPTVSVPERAAGEGFGSAVNCNVPLPVPLAPLVMLSHVVALLTAVHAQPLGAVMATDRAPPPAGTSSEELATVTVQGGGAGTPACVTVNV